MKKLFPIFVLLLAITLFNSISYGCGKIAGIINYDGDKTGRVIIATFSVPFDCENPVKLDTLDAPGFFYINGLDAGTYYISAYMDIDNNNMPGLNEPMGLYPTPISVGEGELAANKDFSLFDLPRGSASVSGNIAYYGTAQGELRVYGLGATLTPFNNTFSNWPASSNYTLPGLYKGDYLIVAYIDQNGNQLPDANEPLGVSAGFTTVNEGEAKEGVDILLLDQQMHNSSIAGTVSYDGNKDGDIHVMVGGLAYTPFREVVADPMSGTYKLKNLSLGEYIVFAYKDVNNNSYFDIGEPFAESYANKILLLPNSSKTGINLTLNDQGSSSISGEVSYAGSQTGTINVAALGISATPLKYNTATQEGAYTISGLAPGIYAVGAFMDTNDDQIPNQGEAAGLYLTDVVYVIPGYSATSINFSIDEATDGAISGNIYAPDYLSGKIYVTTFGLSNSPLEQVMISGAGHYRLNNLGSGGYIVTAFMDVNGDGIYNLNEPMGYTESFVGVSGNNETNNIDIYLMTTRVTSSLNDNSEGNVAKSYNLLQNYPNPFNPTTTINFQIPEESHVTIKIYNLLGEEVATLINQNIQAGNHSINWNASDYSGNKLSSGFYIYKMKTNNFESIRKMTLIR